MELLVVLIAGLVLSIPIMAIVALVRTGKLRDLLDASNTEHRREFEFLRKQVERLQCELNQVAEREPKPAAALEPVRAAVAEAKPAAVAPPPAPKPVILAPPPVIPAPAPVPAPAPQVAKAEEHAPLAPKVEPTIPVPAFAASHATPISPIAARKEASIQNAVTPSTTAGPQTAAPPRTPPPAPGAPTFAPTAPPRKSLRERLGATLPLEEILGMNVFAKIGIILLVLGFALLGRMALIAMEPGQR